MKNIFLLLIGILSSKIVKIRNKNNCENDN